MLKTGQKYGIKLITDVLRGKSSEKVQSLGFENISTFGIMKGTRASEIEEIIERLEELGYIYSTDSEYPVMKVTRKSSAILRGDEVVTIKRRKNMLTGLKKEYNNSDSVLLGELKNTRMKIAKRRGVPAYAVFSDATLIDMCRVLPVSETDMLRVSGVGTYKIEKYGKEFINVIKNYTDKANEIKNNKEIKKPEKSYKKNGRAGEPWTEHEDNKLRFEYELGLAINKIAEFHQRTPGAIRSRLKKKYNDFEME
jgi:ATP-dependent DNA helicase RecQ